MGSILLYQYQFFLAKFLERVDEIFKKTEKRQHEKFFRKGRLEKGRSRMVAPLDRAAQAVSETIQRIITPYTFFLRFFPMSIKSI